MASEREKKAPAGLGTFAGVFTPSVLTILGIILFLRLGYVVGNAGLGRALVIIALANVISVLTSVSLATIATNLRVKGGGDYYLISRTLGAEFGGALGIVLFLAQSVSIAFYAIGFGEALATILGSEGAATPQLIAAAAVAALFVLAWLGADVATRFQFVVMAILAAALVAFFVGGLPRVRLETLRENWTGSSGVPFWLAFAIFFPAVTGFTQGVSMSGDLKDPARSLPLGTFLAVGVSIAVYFAVAVVFAGALPGETLASDYGAMRRLAPAVLIDAGVIAATLSSALASFLGAPRILQSLARDRVFPFLTPFAAGHGASENPRRGVLLAAGIALSVIAIGDLNLVAPIVSMFFLISYGLLNLATWYESKADSPSFRPTFRFHRPWVSLLGALACLGAMLAINPVAGIAAAAVLFGIHQYLTRSITVARWADSSRSHLLRRVRADLHAISEDLPHPRDWRPVILAFSDDPERRQRILRFAGWIEGRSGFTTAVRILTGRAGAAGARKREAAEAELRADVVRGDREAFALAIAAPEFLPALPVVLQSQGLGPIRANTVLLNWFDPKRAEDEDGLREYGQYLRPALHAGLNLIVLETSTEQLAALDEVAREDRRIDVWFLGDATGRLCLLLAYLMTRTEEWEDATIRLLAPLPDGEDPAAAEEELRSMLADVRIPAEPHLVPGAGAEAIRERYKDAAVVFLPFPRRGDAIASPLGGTPAALTEGLATTALVLAARDIDLEAEPEEGAHGEIAQATDDAADATAKARRAEKLAAAAVAGAEKAREKVEKLGEGEAGASLESTATRAEREAQAARRKAAKATAKADAAEKAAREAAGIPEPEEPDPPPG